MNLPSEFAEITTVHPSLMAWRLYTYEPNIGTRLWEDGRNHFKKWLAPLIPQLFASSNEEAFFKAITGCFPFFMGSDVIEDDVCSDPCYRRYVNWLRRELAPSNIVPNDLFHYDYFIFRKRTLGTFSQQEDEMIEVADGSKLYYLVTIERQPQPGFPYCRVCIRTFLGRIPLKPLQALQVPSHITHFPSFKAFFRRFLQEGPTVTFAERLSALCSPAYAFNTVLKSQPATTYLHQLPLPAIERIRYFSA